MPVKAGDLEVVASLRDNVSEKLGTMETNTENLRAKFAVAGAAVTAFSAVAGRDFDAAKTTIVQGTGATGTALDGLITSFQNLSGTVAGADNDAVANAVADMNTAFGVTGTELEGVATDILQAKQAFGDFDTSTAAQAMSLFGIEADGVGGFMDTLGTVSAATDIDMSALITNLKTYGPVFKNMGLDADETATFMGKMHQSGVDISRVMPGVNLAMNKAAKGGVTDLKNHMDTAILSIRDAKTDTDALKLSTQTFGSEGAQRMVTAIRTGVLPTLADLDTQYVVTKGHTTAVYAETVTLGDKLTNAKNKALALVGPFGDAAAGIGSVATGAVLAGPQLAGLATTIGTKLIPLLLGPVGLIALVGTAAVIAFQDLKKEADNLDKQFADVTDTQALRTEIQGLETDLEAARKKAGETKTRIGTFGGVTKDVADNKVVALEYSLQQARDRLDEMSTAAVDLGTDTVDLGTDVEDLSEKVGGESEQSLKKSMKGLITNIGGVQLKFGQLTSEDFPNLITAIADIPNQRDWKITGDEIGSPLMTGIVDAVEDDGPLVVSAAEAFSGDIATALLNGQDIADALESAFKANIVKSIAKDSGDFIGDLIGKAAGPKIAGLIAGPIGGALAVLASGFLSKITGALGSAFGGGTAGEARDMGATRFRNTGSGPEFYRRATDGSYYWYDAAGNPSANQGGGGGDSAGGDPGRSGAPGGGSSGAPGGDIVVNIDGEEVARATARHLPEVADTEGW